MFLQVNENMQSEWDSERNSNADLMICVSFRYIFFLFFLQNKYLL